MKYDLNKKLTIGASRTLKALQTSMLILLSKKAFEEISVQELCEVAMLPRATFYNYFDDKYDLLEYCFLAVHKQLEIVDDKKASSSNRAAIWLVTLIDILDENVMVLQQVLKNNHPNKYLFIQMRYYVLRNMIAAFTDCANTYEYNIPKAMAARLYCDAILIILEWKYMEKKECTKEQAKEYLITMTKALEVVPR